MPDQPPTTALQDLPESTKALLVAYIGALATLGVLGTAFSPYLLVEKPLALVALSPETRHLVLAAPEVGLTGLVAVGGTRRLLALVATWIFGGLYGAQALQWTARRFPRLQRLIRWVERVAHKGGAPLLVISPAYPLALIAGATGMRFSVFLGAAAAGNAIWVAVLHFFGDALSMWIAMGVQFLADRLLGATLLCAGLVAVQQGLQWRRRLRQRGANLEAAMEQLDAGVQTG